MIINYLHLKLQLLSAAGPGRAVLTLFQRIMTYFIVAGASAAGRNSAGAASPEPPATR
jgi:hypothetical protein